MGNKKHVWSNFYIFSTVSLIVNVLSTISIASFRERLKTYLFTKAYPPKPIVAHVPLLVWLDCYWTYDYSHFLCLVVLKSLSID